MAGVAASGSDFAARRLMDAMGGRIFLEPNGYASRRFVVALPAQY